MAMVVRFTPQGMNSEKYDEIIRSLDAAGAGAPVGRLYHVCFGDQDNLSVSDIWDTMDNFQAFGMTLMPILHRLGVDPGTPDFVEIHNIIAG